ncbi:hypothetical protein DL770_010960 [Monosporascus sp. CRB-9-2]|nr:hypothetical protein DL770_010960 [Monosporascus sp. CRB-9-2]
MPPKRTTKAKKGRKEYNGYYTNDGSRWFCNICKKTISAKGSSVPTHINKKHNPKSAFAKKAANGPQVQCSKPGCTYRATNFNNFQHHHRSSHGHRGPSQGLYDEFQRAQREQENSDEEEANEEDDGEVDGGGRDRAPGQGHGPKNDDDEAGAGAPAGIAGDVGGEVIIAAA